MKFKNSDLIRGFSLLSLSLIGVMVFYVIPFGIMIFFSFFDVTEGMQFVGLGNYFDLLQNDVYQLAVKNTVLFMVISLPLLIIIPLLLALGMNNKIPFRDKLRTAYVTPMVVPVASVILFFDILFDYNGVVSKLVFDISGYQVDWMNSNYAILVIVMIFLWKNVGYNMVLFIAGLQGIPLEYYEAANIDGANALQKFTNITFIYLLPTSFFVLVISIINTFKIFKEIYLLEGRYPHESIYMLQHYLNNLFAKLNYNKLVASAVLLALVIYVGLFF